MPRLVEAKGLSNGWEYQVVVTNRGQGHERDAISEVRKQVCRNLDGQARLATPARAGESDQSRARQQLFHRRDLSLPTNKGGELLGQVVGQRVQRPQRREFRGKLRVKQLKDALRPGEILEPALAQIA